MSEDLQDGGGFEGGGDQGASGASHAPSGTGSHGSDAGSISHDGGHSPADSGAHDWRSAYLNGLDDASRDRASKYLERRKGHNDVLRSALEGERKITELTESLKGRIKVPGENDSPEDIAAFRTALGVPEEASAYEIWEQEGAKWDHSQRAGIAEFLADAHGAHLSQKQVDVCLQALARVNALTMQAWENGGQEALQRTQAELRREWGREYQANVTLADREMRRLFGNDSQGVANLRLADGRFLGDHPAFLRNMVRLAKEGADAGMLEMGDGHGTADSRESRLDELYSLQTSDYKKYKSKAVQDEIMRLEASKQNRGPRR